MVRLGSEEQRRAVLAEVGGAFVELCSPYAHYVVVKLLQVDTLIPIFLFCFFG